MDESNEYRSPEELIDNLAIELLGFETDELKQIRESAKNTENSEKITELRDSYQEIAQSLTNEPKDQLGIMLASALMLKYSGDIQGFIHELSDAEIFATGFYGPEAGSQISKLIEIIE